jgi:hypothetical protein
MTVLLLSLALTTMGRSFSKVSPSNHELPFRSAAIRCIAHWFVHFVQNEREG